ncbi:MAG TPA: hypothetical protein PL112_19990 [Candidatus Obscuribacter sp.]|nr:hypothetical protein [Candidatus Obscuribacter sp.]MBK9278749.1 hypothetical protein [Candidatus Obscuribacter sp.]MBL8084399.1 hypothetical protein [Candidatus Obscuribacter sp.]HND69097.1 hypothetical protein [Candidatus Obscuribacter sp.]
MKGNSKSVNLIIALLLAPACFTCWLFLSNLDTPTVHDPAMQKVVVAVKDLPDGSVITQDAVQETQLHKKRIPLCSVASAKDVVLRVSAGIEKGQVIIMKRIKTPRMGEPEAPCGAWPINGSQ